MIGVSSGNTLQRHSDKWGNKWSNKLGDKLGKELLIVVKGVWQYRYPRQYVSVREYTPLAMEAGYW